MSILGPTATSKLTSSFLALFVDGVPLGWCFGGDRVARERQKIKKLEAEGKILPDIQIVRQLEAMFSKEVGDGRVGRVASLLSPVSQILHVSLTVYALRKSEYPGLTCRSFAQRSAIFC